jgi:ATP-binding cassette subfamily C protein
MKSLPTATGTQSWAEVRGLLKPRRKQAALAILVLVTAAAVGLSGPLLLGVIVDRIDEGGDITAPALALIGVAVAEALLFAIGLVLISNLGQPILATLRERVVARALKLPAEQVERGGRGFFCFRYRFSTEPVPSRLRFDDLSSCT